MHDGSIPAPFKGTTPAAYSLSAGKQMDVRQLAVDCTARNLMARSRNSCRLTRQYGGYITAPALGSHMRRRTGRATHVLSRAKPHLRMSNRSAEHRRGGLFQFAWRCLLTLLPCRASRSKSVRKGGLWEMKWCGTGLRRRKMDDAALHRRGHRTRRCDRRSSRWRRGNVLQADIQKTRPVMSAISRGQVARFGAHDIPTLSGFNSPGGCLHGQVTSHQRGRPQRAKRIRHDGRGEVDGGLQPRPPEARRHRVARRA